MNIYWLNPPPRTNYIVADVGWMNFSTFCKEYNWISPIIDWENYNEISEVLNHIISNNTDVLCVSTYVWNHNLVNEITKQIKRIKPEIVIIRGGPHQGYDETFFDRFPEIDYLCYSTGHGELFLKEALKQIKKYNSILFPSNVPFLISKRFKSTVLSGKYPYPEESSLQYKFDYLTELSIAAKHKNKPLVMPYETSRGCPYECVYCEWGGGTGTKVSKKSMEVIKKDIDIISYLKFDDVEIIDANFGIFNQDIDILNYILEHRRLTGYPKTVMTYGLAKVKQEKKERILDAMFQEGLVQTYCMSLQSINEDVLQQSKRTDISTDEQIQLAKKYIEKYNANVKVEIILGMPGTTLDIFYEEMDVFQITGSWYNARNVYQLLPDTEAYTKEYREKYKIKSAFIGTSENDEEVYYSISKGIISKYKSSSEIIVETYSFTKQDWKEMFFMNHAQRVLGPKLEKNQKASIVLRKWFNDNKNKSWYLELDKWLDRIVNNELSAVNTDKFKGIFLAKYVEDNFNGF